MTRLQKGDMVEFSGYFEKKIDKFKSNFVLDCIRRTGMIVECDSTTAVILCNEGLVKIDTANPMTFINKLKSEDSY